MDPNRPVTFLDALTLREAAIIEQALPCRQSRERHGGAVDGAQRCGCNAQNAAGTRACSA